MTPDPAQVAAQITGCERVRHTRIVNSVKLAPVEYCLRHHWHDRWPCDVLADATEVIWAALEQQRIHTLEQAAADLYADTGYAMAAQWLNERASYPTPKEEAP